jgi:hypothetical protein
MDPSPRESADARSAFIIAGNILTDCKTLLNSTEKTVCHGICSQSFEDTLLARYWNRANLLRPISWSTLDCYPSISLRAGQVKCWVRWDWALLFVLCCYIGNVRLLSAGRSLGKQSWLANGGYIPNCLRIHSFSHPFIRTFTGRSDLFLGWQLLIRR